LLAMFSVQHVSGPEQSWLGSNFIADDDDNTVCMYTLR
jgi:hypothetical protein